MTKTYAQLSREIASLQAAAEKLRHTEMKAAVAKANELIATYGLAADDLTFPKSGSVSSAIKGQSARYSDGLGHTWGGRGPHPAWLRDALAAGRTLQSFQTGGASVPSAPPSGTTKKAGFKVAIKYRNAVTGDSWSGRGSQPAWLKAALKKRGVKIEDFLVDAPAASKVASPAVAAAKKPTTRKPAAKPAVKKKKTVSAATKPAAKAPVAKKPMAKPSVARKVKATAGAADGQPSTPEAVLPV
ncbi:H-NS family nucleoid-associated regulatory protein [Variovorax ginsengisoli]|uniref:DNA-binding protein H-NS n=1 Tax=Variovorax ginsengisoli TaxID=363844 RepID=A0ABT9S3Y1_9BURK|nr:H-NS family nucleoid-associated regulatory protein [Variovorax ginsengisoli]MDP9899040.1 DNA-binding protein H-NS [Variovorax ginsengisoli]